VKGNQEPFSNSIRKIFDTPWKFQNEILRSIEYPWIRILFALRGISWHRGWKIYGFPIIQKHRKSKIRFGPGLSLRSSIRSNPLGPNHPVIVCTWEENAVIDVGEDFGMTGGTLCASERISIGDHVVIGANCSIIDTDFHPQNIQARRSFHSNAPAIPIIIQDDVFIGMNSLILKGVNIGSGVIIGAGSVVTHDIPSGMIAAGNPAKVIRSV
jgi:acetyltransferase-like isoleucine patch superfamily enzyme